MQHRRRQESGRPSPETGLRSIITAIQPTRRRKRRFLLEFDNTEPLEISDWVLVHFGMHVGDEFESTRIREIALAESEHHAKEVALNYLSYRPRSSREVSDHLVRKGFDRNLAIDVARRFQTLSLINDLEFARMFVRDKMARRPLGASMLRQYLYTKGIADPMIDQVLAETITTEQQLATATEQLAKRMKNQARSLAKLEPIARRRRLSDYLQRRGFEWSIIDQAMKAAERNAGR